MLNSRPIVETAASKSSEVSKLKMIHLSFLLKCNNLALLSDP